MANFKVNDVPSWVQYTATDMQTQFSIPFPFIDNTDLSVWQNGVLLTLTTDYTLSGAQTSSGGQLTLNTGASLNDQIVIQDLMVIDRTNIYQPTISALTGSALNNDFNRDIILIRDTTTTVNYLMLQYPPYALISQDIDVTVDRRLPILPANSTWQKNSNNTAIIAVSLPTTVVGVEGSFTNDNRLTSTNLGPGDNYIQQTDLQCVNDTITAISGNLILTGSNDVNIVTPGQVVFTPGTNLVLDGTKWPLSGSAPSKALVLSPTDSTQLEWDFVGSAEEIQNNAFTYADDVGSLNEFAITLDPAPASYEAGLTVFFKAANTNTGPSTLNVNGLGALNLDKNFDAALVAGDIVAGQVVEATYDGSFFQMVSPVANMFDGGGVNPASKNDLAYYASTGSTISGLATANSAMLVTSSLGVPSLSTTMPDGMHLGTPSSGTLTDCTGLPISTGVSGLGTGVEAGLVLTATGTGGIVRATNPTFTNNLIFNASDPVFIDQNNHEILILNPQASAVNVLVVANSASGQPVVLGPQGSDTNIDFLLVGQGTGGVEIKGVSDGSNAPTGCVGEFITSSVNFSSRISASSPQTLDITSISLTAGDWDVEGNVYGVNGSNTGMVGWSSTISATVPDVSLTNKGFNSAGNFGTSIPKARYNFTSTTTVYLSCMYTSNSGSGAVCGGISARRVR